MIPRWCHRVYARVAGYYWAECPRCGRWYGGHEAKGSIPTGGYLCRLTCCPPYSQPTLVFDGDGDG